MKIKHLRQIKKLATNKNLMTGIQESGDKLKVYMIKINKLSNKLNEYIEQNKKQEDTELLDILKDLIEIQEIFTSNNYGWLKDTPKIIEGEFKR